MKGEADKTDAPADDARYEDDFESPTSPSPRPAVPVVLSSLIKRRSAAVWHGARSQG